MRPRKASLPNMVVRGYLLLRVFLPSLHVVVRGLPARGAAEGLLALPGIMVRVLPAHEADEGLLSLSECGGEGPTCS
jgi:hypothetical protein